ncbi:MAG: hypothetical protein U0Q16_35365 [Bryobacteraceae bacterium]
MVDPIVEEVRRLREEHAARFNYDLDAIFADFKRLEGERGAAGAAFDPRHVSLAVATAEDTAAVALTPGK